MPSRAQALQRSCDRKTQTILLTGQEHESVVFVKTLSRFVFGVYHHRKYTKFRPRRAFQRISQENAAEALTLAMLAHSKTSQQYRGNHGIARQFFGDLRRQRIEGDARGCQRVVTGDISGRRAHRNEACRDAAPDIL